MIVSLGTDIADPRERLVAVRDSTRQSKEFTSAHRGARTLTEYSAVRARAGWPRWRRGRRAGSAWPTAAIPL